MVGGKELIKHSQGPLVFLKSQIFILKNFTVKKKVYFTPNKSTDLNSW